jgi:hypothetical protein
MAGVRASTSVTQWVLVAVLGLGVGIGGTLALLPPRAPASLGNTSARATFPITLQADNDAQPVQLSLISQAVAKVISPVQGVITQTSCEPGVLVTSGSAPFSISGIPILVLSTSVPPWRNFTPRLRGADVAAVQAELVRLGYAAGGSGVWDSRTEVATEALQRHLGIPSHGGSLLLTDFSWQAATSLKIISCQALLGEQVEPGSPIFIPAASVTSARVTNLPSGVLPGDREVQVGNLNMPVSADGVISDTASVAKLLASPNAVAAVASLSSSDPSKISGQYVLADPPQAAQVPAASVLATNDRTSCVFEVSGKSLSVQILGSTLGRTTIEFEDGKAPTTILLNAPTGGTCK